MPTRIMDQGPLYPFSQHSEASTLFSEEQHLVSKNITCSNSYSTEGRQLISGSKPVATSFELSNSLINGQKTKSSLGNNLMNPRRMNNINTIPRVADHIPGSRADLLALPAPFVDEGIERDLNESHYENGLFSSSFSDMFNKMRLSSKDVPLVQSIDAFDLNFGGDEPFKPTKEIEAQTIGNLLPDDDDLLSGVIDDMGYLVQPNDGNDIDDDIFYSGGGIELEKDDNLNGHKASEFDGKGAPTCQQSGLTGPSSGEHPDGEHPSRTLFVRNINSNVEDAELRELFEQYGDIRTLYTACKHRGFVMISYYDLRAACNAMQALQNKPLRRRKLDIHFSIPKDNPSEKDINQGELMVLNLDSSVTNDYLHQLFGAYGEIKEIRETLYKHHQKSIEFYDVRAAEAALHALDRSEIAGKKIKLELSHSRSVTRQCLIQHLTQELDEKELKGFCHGSPNASLPWSECFGSPFGVNTPNNLENGAIQDFKSAVRAPCIQHLEGKFHEISSSMAQNLPSPVKTASVSNHVSQDVHDDISHTMGQMNFGIQDMPAFLSHSLPDYHNGVKSGIPHNSSTIRAMGVGVISRPSDVIDKRNSMTGIVQRLGSGSLSGHTVDPNEEFGGPANVSGSLYGHQHVWNNTNSLHHRPPNPMLWSTSPSFINSIPTHYSSQIHGVPKTQSHMLNAFLPVQHHAGSAPAVNPSLWNRRHAYAGDSMELHALHPGSLGSTGPSPISQLHWLELASRNIFSHGVGNCIDSSISANIGIPSPQERGQMFNGRNPMFPIPGSFDSPNERLRNRRNDINANQNDSKKQFELDIERIIRGEDSRTTLMIKNIPNKYTSKMLLAAIDEKHRGTYDFIYLPIDFKNKCNVGYAFINMINPQHIITFYQSFNGKKWEKFNSEKVASLAYARIQGKAALVAHFQNSSLMNEDKRCRPILFHTDGPNAGDQEPFPVGNNVKLRSGRSRTVCSGEDSSTSANGEASFDAVVSPSDYAKDSN